jgi:outer membrane protein assembly factor BamB
MGWAPCLAPTGVLFLAGDASLTALSTSTGATVWTYTNTDIVLTTPALSPDGSLVVVATPYQVLGVHAGTGTLVWATNLTQYDTFASITLDPAGDVYVVVTGGVLALNGSCGEVRWNFSVDSYPPPALALGSGGLLYVATPSGVHALDCASGHEVWSVGTPVSESVVVTVAGDDVVLHVTTGGPSREFLVSALDGANGTLLWAYGVPNYHGDDAVALVLGPGPQLLLVSSYAVHSIGGACAAVRVCCSALPVVVGTRSWHALGALCLAGWQPIARPHLAGCPCMCSCEQRTVVQAPMCAPTLHQSTVEILLS